MRTTISLFALAAIATTAACARVQTDPVTGRTDVDVESPLKAGEGWTARLNGQGSFSSLTGESRARVENGRTNVTISLANAAPGGTHPWHIHEGKCGSGGPIVGPASDYQPLVIGGEGRGAGNASVSAGLNEARDYYVNVHLSPSAMATIVACGDLDD